MSTLVVYIQTFLTRLYLVCCKDSVASSLGRVSSWVIPCELFGFYRDQGFLRRISARFDIWLQERTAAPPRMSSYTLSDSQLNWNVTLHRELSQVSPLYDPVLSMIPSFLWSHPLYDPILSMIHYALHPKQQNLFQHQLAKTQSRNIKFTP
jgi:hypothetical protein